MTEDALTCGHCLYTSQPAAKWCPEHGLWYWTCPQCQQVHDVERNVEHAAPKS